MPMLDTAAASAGESAGLSQDTRPSVTGEPCVLLKLGEIVRSDDVDWPQMNTNKHKFSPWTSLRFIGVFGVLLWLVLPCDCGGDVQSQ